nr:hypothetical protein [uncultured Roseococcus sp.]
MSTPTAAQQIMTRLTAMERQLQEQAQQIRDLRRQPEARFRQAQAVAMVTARMLRVMTVPEDLIREWKDLIIEGDDPAALERSSLRILDALDQVLSRAMQMREEAQDG